MLRAVSAPFGAQLEAHREAAGFALEELARNDSRAALRYPVSPATGAVLLSTIEGDRGLQSLGLAVPRRAG